MQATTPSYKRGAIVTSGYQQITDEIIAQLEAGTAPWNKPWSCKLPVNLKSQKEYRGINVFLLACKGYASPYWLTYKQAASIGGNVRKGEHGTRIVFWQVGKYQKRDVETGESKDKTSILLRTYTVFNLTQCEGIEGFDVGRVANPIQECEALVAGMPNPPRRELNARACYNPQTDVVGMPAQQSFRSDEDFYSCLYHELTHSVGHNSRVGREGIEHVQNFGSDSYSKEELIAEMGAAFLCGVSGIEKATLGNSAAYLASWIRVLKADSKLVVQAASAAQKAVDYIRGIKPVVESAEVAQ